jgi:hypothetical protein
MVIPTDTRFVLSAPIDTVPAGATGQLTRLDSYHVALAFDHYPDLVFDVEDTESAVWEAIAPTVNPSMTDPPERDIALSLASLLITTPMAMLFMHYTGRGAIITFFLGVAWSAMRYGWRGALPLAVGSLIVDQFVIDRPDQLALIPTSLIEWYAFAGLFFLALARDLVARKPVL